MNCQVQRDRLTTIEGIMFDIKKSKKAYIESTEHFVVVRDGVV